MSSSGLNATGNATSGNVFAGIAVGASDRNRLLRNRASGNRGGGIAIVDAAVGTLLTGNTADDNGAEPFRDCIPDCPLLDDGILLPLPKA
jgi:parallel beta-helix repeat protein